MDKVIDDLISTNSWLFVKNHKNKCKEMRSIWPAQYGHSQTFLNVIFLFCWCLRLQLGITCSSNIHVVDTLWGIFYGDENLYNI